MEEDEMGWTCGTHVLGEIFFWNLFGRPNVKRPMGRTRRRWDFNTKMDLRK
jgi:hypothetical protein